MSTLPNFPKLPASVGGQAIPDFLKFKVKGPVKRQPLQEKFNFAVKTSPAFGSAEGTAFDEGKLWHPLRALEFTADGATGTLQSFRAHYHARSTRLIGKEGERKTSLTLGKAEFVTGISGSAAQYITNLVVHTNERKVIVVDGKAGKPFDFLVPEDHQVVAFHGTETGAQVTSLGLSYQRRLESVADSKVRDGPTPVLTGYPSNQWLDAQTQNAWSKNDMPTIEKLRQQAQEDLLPIYANINIKGDDAWVEVESEDKETYYVSYTTNGVIWAYTQDQPGSEGTTDGAPTKDVIVSIGSYSTTANFLGISLYNWKNLPTTIISALVGLGFAYLVRPIIQVGVEMGIAAAANLLVEGLAAAGVESAAILVPASVASTGGLIIAGILGVALVLGCIALASVIFKQYFLIFNIYNFDTGHQWTTVQHYEDNSVVSNGAWTDQSIAPFVEAGGKIAPPGFNPVTTLNNVVTYLNVNFQNDSTVLQGLGEGIVVNRDDAAAGLAVKYIVHRLSKNQIGAQGIDGNGVNFDLGDYYNNGKWVTAQNIQTSAGGYTVDCFTPALSGASDDTYTYEVNIGLPPPA
ncbi:hypothetical protein AURDEDRAFT_123282 [Auricularia subglabra TFB-10046 SS5]|nr:hypothetical protein AURDEDRAFT_123282 [Auricularia subglabra TFB-10046 SS5]